MPTKSLMELEFDETVGSLLELAYYVFNKKMKGNKWFRGECPTLYIPLHPTFKGDYDLRRSTKFTFWVTATNEIIADVSHLRKHLLFVISYSSVRCVLKSEIDVEGVLISKVGGYCVDYTSKAAVLKHDDFGWISLLEYKDKKGRLHRSDGKPASLEKLNRGFYTYKTYKHGKLHSYGEAPAIIEYDGGGEIIKEHFYHKGFLRGIIDREINITTYYDRGEPVAEFRGGRFFLSRGDPCGNPDVECMSYDVRILEDETVAYIVDRPGVPFEIEIEGGAEAPLAKRLFETPYFERRYTFDYPALRGYFYGTTSPPLFKTERYYFVHLNEPLDKPIYEDGKVVRWEVTSLAQELRSTTQLYFKGQKVWQPFIPLSSFRTGGIFITTEVFTFALKPEFMSLNYIWHLSPLGVSGIIEPPTGVKWTDSKPQVKPFDRDLIVRDPEGWDGDSLPVLVKDMKTSPFEKGDLGNQHFGQRKLLLSEIEFLTSITETTKNPITVFYAGAAPGEHTPLLVDMFPQVTFVLFDPHFKDNKSKVRIKPRKRMFIVNDFFWGDEFDIFGEKVYFISDIRTDNSNEQVDANNKLQNKWVSHTNVKGAMLKLRFPFGAGQSLAPDGVLVTQAWAPDSSAECRLFTKGKKLIKYDHLTHEGRMFYFNSVLRKLKYTKLDPVFGVSYDVMREAGIIHNYLAKFFDGNLDRVIAAWMAWFDDYLHRIPRVSSMVSEES